MPKLLVVVEKDNSGKLWDYAFTQQEWGINRNSFWDAPLLIHKIDLPETVPKRVQMAPAQQESVMVGVLPRNEIRVLSKKPARRRRNKLQENLSRG